MKQTAVQMQATADWSTVVSGGNIVLRISSRLTDDVARDVLLRFLRTVCRAEPETGLRTLGVCGQPFAVLLNEETGRVERSTVTTPQESATLPSFVHMAALLMGAERVEYSPFVFAQKGGYERLYDDVRISLHPVAEGQEGWKMTAEWLDAQAAVDAWMEEAEVVLDRMGVQATRVESDHWNMVTARCPLAMTDERMQALLRSGASSPRTITRYYVQKGAGLYASAEEWAALERLYPALKDENLWLGSRCCTRPWRPM